MQNITAYIEDMARRHPLVLHGEAGVQRFFDLEWDDMVENGAKLAGKGWNIVLEDYQEEHREDGGEYEYYVASVAIMILTNVPRGKEGFRKDAYVTARAIAQSFRAKMKREHAGNCDPDVPDGVRCPEWVDPNKGRFQRVQPPFNGFDNSAGIRMVVRWTGTDETPLDKDTTEWLPRV